jgi:hypothetical protein
MNTTYKLVINILIDKVLSPEYTPTNITQLMNGDTIHWTKRHVAHYLHHIVLRMADEEYDHPAFAVIATPSILKSLDMNVVAEVLNMASWTIYTNVLFA